MRLIPQKTNIPFMSGRKYAFALSSILIIISLTSIFVRGVPLGLDFTGGISVQVQYPHRVELASIRSALSSGGYKDASVTYFGSSHNVMIRLQLAKGAKASGTAKKVVSDLQKVDSTATFQGVQFVGPEVGSQLFEKGGLALVYALIGVLIYVLFRFEWRFAVGAVLALVHDCVITIGFFSLFGLQFDLTVLAAVLAIIGYSVNDTVVVFDRIRENYRRLRKRNTEQIMNISINETLSRTIITSGATLLTLLSLLIVGGESVHGFSVALIVGILVGTYSSVAVASALALSMGVRREDFIPSERKDSEDAMP